MLNNKVITIVDYKIGNIGSIVNMLKRIGVKAILTSNPDEIQQAEKLILPGVGSFDHGMKNLRDSGLVDALSSRVLEDKVPVLGICLGMQLLLKGSEEGSAEGLGWINGGVKKFNLQDCAQPIKVPHMGWNLAQPARYNTLFKGMEDEARFYFVHSYHAVCEDAGDVASTTHHGYDFASAVQSGNIYGVQFHPEKSHKFGMAILQNFVELG